MKPGQNPFNVTHGLGTPPEGFYFCKKGRLSRGIEDVLREHRRNARPIRKFDDLYYLIPASLLAKCLEVYEENLAADQARFRRNNNLPDDWKPPGPVWTMPDEDDYNLIR